MRTLERPTGPAWYQTHAVAYAQEVGRKGEILGVPVPRDRGVPDPWHGPLKSAYVDTLADMGVTKDPPTPGSGRRWRNTSRPTPC